MPKSKVDRINVGVGKVETHSWTEKGGSARKSIKVVLDIEYSDERWMMLGKLSHSECVMTIEAKQPELGSAE